MYNRDQNRNVSSLLSYFHTWEFETPILSNSVRVCQTVIPCDPLWSLTWFFILTDLDLGLAASRSRVGEESSGAEMQVTVRGLANENHYLSKKCSRAEQLVLTHHQQHIETWPGGGCVHRREQQRLSLPLQSVLGLHDDCYDVASAKLRI